MNQKAMLQALDKVAQLAAASKWERFWESPLRYAEAVLFREVVFKQRRKEHSVWRRTFFGAPMQLLLPSGTDIYLTGGKTHPSEIRLARFLIRHLREGDIFFDIGAHYGYFTLLASALVGSNGRVVAFEAAPATFPVLKTNTRNITNVSAHDLALSDKEALLTFYEFPNLYSEYNTLNIEQFKGERWFTRYPPREIRIPSVRLDTFVTEMGLRPTVLKIDVEGAEDSVMRGAQTYLTVQAPLIVMEYLAQKRHNASHRRAEEMLRALGYYPFCIDEDGGIQPLLGSIATYLTDNCMESDNVVFVKNQPH